MARRRYYRVKRVYPKKKWSSLMKTGSSTQTMASGATEVVVAYDLVKNSTESDNPTPVIIKTGNIKMTGTLSTSVSTSDITKLYQCMLFVMYCPQGYTYDSFTKIANHPEYIMAKKTLCYIPGQQTTFSTSSRLKRNLNSGDKIQYVIYYWKESSLVGTMGLYYQYQYYTCSN